MPELPEVETIKRGLENKIVGLKIKDVEILNPKTFQGDPKKADKKTVNKIWRRAKILGIDLDSNLTLLFHLKMSGQLVYQGKTRFIGGHPTQDMKLEMPNNSTRVIFTFSNDTKLYFNDQRKFGWIKLVKSSELGDQSFLQKLGPEPLDKTFSWQVLKSRVMNHKSMPVKAALMDQSLISGIGNIYASEACFEARIDPKKKVGQLNDKEYQALFKGILKSLEEGINHGGSSRAHFVNADGEKGYFLDYANVYNRQGDLCKRCGGVIKKIKLGGRGTYFCPNCQR